MNSDNALRSAFLAFCLGVSGTLACGLVMDYLLSSTSLGGLPRGWLSSEVATAVGLTASVATFAIRRFLPSFRSENKDALGAPSNDSPWLQTSGLLLDTPLLLTLLILTLLLVAHTREELAHKTISADLLERRLEERALADLNDGLVSIYMRDLEATDRRGSALAALRGPTLDEAVRQSPNSAALSLAYYAKRLREAEKRIDAHIRDLSRESAVRIERSNKQASETLDMQSRILDRVRSAAESNQ